MDNEELQALLADGQKEQETVISELKEGRQSPEPKTEDCIHQLDPEGHDVMDHVKRKDKLVRVSDDDPYLMDSTDPESGRPVIVTGGSGSGASFRLEPVARIPVALQKLIVKRAVAFLFGNPVKIVASPKEGTKEPEALNALQAVLSRTKSQTLNRRVAREVFSCTEAAELWYPVKGENSDYGFRSNFKLRTALFSPLKGDKLYPYFDETGDLIAFSREFEIRDKNDPQQAAITYFETYTAAEHRMWSRSKESKGAWVLVDGYPKTNLIGKIPVIYASQPQPEWADVQPLIDRLETLLSNFADTNDYHASPKIVTKGQILSFARKGESGAVIEMDKDGEAHYLTWDKAPDSVKLEIETLLKLIYSITQTPDISWDAVKGMNVSGVALKLLFMDAHLKVQDKLEIFEDYLQRRYSVVLSYLSQLNAQDAEFAEACHTLLAEPEVTPYMISDDKDSVDVLMSATGQKAILSRKSAIRRLGWAKDPDAELEQIEQDESSQDFTDITEPTI